jgi:hypothetical protein
MVSTTSGPFGLLEAQRELLLLTRRGVVERMGDPYLNDHDRWVLGQFGAFLGGVAPAPDPRARVPGERPLRRGCPGRRV